MMNDDERIKLAIQLVFPTKGIKWAKNAEEMTEFSRKTTDVVTMIRVAELGIKARESTAEYKKTLQSLKKGLSQAVKEKDESEGT